MATRLTRRTALVAGGLLVLGAAGVDAGSPAQRAEPVTITIWHAQIDAAAKAMEGVAARFHELNPDITVKVEQGSAGDQMLTKLTTVLSTDTYPDIAYVYGTDTPALARSDKAVDLTAMVNDPAFGWSDFYDGERAVATVGDKVMGVPALVDNLALVYNKKLFTDAGVAFPTAEWSWDDYRAAAKKLTNAEQKVFGASYPISGDEDTVWRFWPMVWQRGGKAVSDDLKTPTFTDPQFTEVLEFLRQMVREDKSMYVDTSSESLGNLFAASKIAMTITGPWALSQFLEAKVDLGVAPLPGYNGDHQTVSGPDNWMVFNNGEARVDAAKKFLAFLTSPEGDALWSVAAGNMPVRNATRETEAGRKMLTDNPGFKEFVDNFANSKQARPQITTYPAYSLALGEAISAVLQGQGDPKSALEAAQAKAQEALDDQ